ncbi:MAG: ATP-binding protein [Treponema sp.]|nr:ATP-binding protein [Treponema sp.]
MNQPELVKIITGIRRSGKSVMLELIQAELLANGIPKNRILSYNFEDMDIQNLKDPLILHKHLKTKINAIKGRAYLFLDELQEVHNWEACINSLRVKTDTDIYITGSNAKMLAGEYATLLAGRYIEIRIFPFSFMEFCTAIRGKKPRLSYRELFMLYLKQGGMPFISNMGLNESDVKQYLRDIYASVVIKDIMKRNFFRDVDLLERIIIYVMANIGKTFSATSISKFFKSEKRIIAPETILNYLRACEEAYLFVKIKRFDIPGKQMLKINEKYYAADHGFREAVHGYNERDIELMMENMVCMELLRRGYTVNIGRIGGREIDFIGKRAEECVYIQVCYLLASKETIEREFGAYYHINDNFPKYVVSMDELNLSRDGIHHKNIRNFLIDDSW